MNNDKLAYILRAAIIAIAFCGLIICALWYPFNIAISTFGLNSNPSMIAKILFWVQAIFYWGCSIPCFVILIYAWKVTAYIKKDMAFSFEIVKLFKKMSIILFSDLLVFLLGNILLMILQMNYFVLIYFMLSLIGVVIATILAVLAHFIKKAAILKEEQETTI